MFTENLDNITIIVTGAVTTASAVVAITPTPKDDRIWGKVYRVIELVGFVTNTAKQKWPEDAKPQEGRNENR